jgi:hypothetical protein
MVFFVFLVYIAVSFVYPAEIFPSLAAYHITFWVGVLGLVLSIVSLAVKRSSPIRSVQFWFVGVFTLVMALSRMLNERYLGAIVPTLNAFGPSLTMFVLAVCAVDSMRKLRIAAATIGMLSLILVVQGAAAYHFGYQRNLFLFDPTLGMAEYTVATDSRDAAEEMTADARIAADLNDMGVDEEDWGTQIRIRGLGLLHDPNDLAMAFLFALPLFGLGWKSSAPLRNVLIVAIPVAAIVYGVFLTHSRGGTLALILTLCFAVFVRWGKIPAFVLLIVLAGGAVAADFAGQGRSLVRADESAHGRIDAWSEGLQMLKDQPLLGVGYGQFLDHHTLTAHNSYVLCFAETGIVGYFFWLGLLALTFAQLRSIARLPVTDDTDSQLARAAVILQFSMLGVLTAVFFLSRTYVVMLYLMLGIAVAVILIARDSGRPVWSPSLPQLTGLVLGSQFATIALIYVVVKLRLA